MDAFWGSSEPIVENGRLTMGQLQRSSPTPGHPTPQTPSIFIPIALEYLHHFCSGDAQNAGKGFDVFAIDIFAFS